MPFRGSTTEQQSPPAEAEQQSPPAEAEQQSPPAEAGAQRTSTYAEAHRELTEQLIAQGVEAKRAERVAEATLRRAQAREGHSVFYYADVEQEFEQRCRSVCSDPRRIEAGKRRVWTAARATAESRGVALEEALFFCFSEALDVHREILIAVAPDEDAAVAPDEDAAVAPDEDAAVAPDEDAAVAPDDDADQDLPAPGLRDG